MLATPPVPKLPPEWAGTRGWKLIRWALGPKYMVGQALLGVALACTLSRVCDLPRDRAALAGWLLQLAGLSTAVIGLWTLPRTFGKPTFGEELRGWLRQLPRLLRRKPPPVVLDVHSADVGTFATTVELTEGAPPPATMEDRVARLERDHERLEQRVRTHQARTGERISDVEQAVHRTSTALQSRLQELDARQVEVSVGGFHLQLVGLVWFFVGVTWGTLPEQSARMLGFLFGR